MNGAIQQVFEILEKDKIDNLTPCIERLTGDRKDAFEGCSENSEKLKIAVVSYHLPRIGFKRGGVDRLAHELADGLAQRGHDVTVMSYDEKTDGASYEVAPLPLGKFARSWLGFRLMSGYLGNFLLLLLDFRDYDAVITHGDSLLSPFLKTPVLRVVHGSALGEALSAKTPWRFLFQFGVYIQELLTALISKRCVAVSRNTVRHNPFIKNVIANGVCLRNFYPDPAAKSPEPSILFVGDLEGRKRGKLLLEWFAKEVRPRIPEATLLMVTQKGEDAPGVKYFTGISSEELASLYRRAWVYASPSVYEGFGLPYIEAMASGAPVVATPNPGSREVLGDGEFGLLTKDEEFGRALIEILNDEDRRRRMAAAGLARAHTYSLERMIDSYEELLFKVCAEGGKSRRALRQGKF